MAGPFSHSDEAAKVLDLLGRVSLRLWMMSSDAGREGKPMMAAQLDALSDECDAACEMLTPFVRDEDPNNTFGDDFAGFAPNH